MSPKWWCLWIILSAPVLGQDGGLLFHASLDRSVSADFAAGDREPLTAQGVRVESAGHLPPNATLTYDARGNLYAEQGTVSFWWRPDEPPGRLSFPLFLVSYEQHSTWDFNFVRIEWTGSQLAARIRDRDLHYHSIRAPNATPAVGRWMHIALTWSEPDGLALYLDGKLVGKAPGPLSLDARLDQFGLLARAATPHHASGTENAGSIDEVRVYRAPLAASDIARLAARQSPLTVKRATTDWTARFGWREGAGIPVASALRVKRIPIREAKDLGKFWLKGVDGKRETLWPMVSHGYADEGKTYRVRPAGEPINLLRTTGNLAGRISYGSAYVRPPSGEVHYHRFSSPVAVDTITIQRESGVLGDLECLLVTEPARPVVPSGSGGPWITFAPADDPGLGFRRDPVEFAVWKPGPAKPGPSGARYHYLVLPIDTETPLDAVRLRLESTPGAFYYLAIQDPVNTAREVIEVDVQAAGKLLDLTLDFPDLVAPAGRPLVVTLASSSNPTLNPEVQVLRAGTIEARSRHIAERMLQVRDSFQMLSEARPWMRLGRGLTLPVLRRQLKLVDELYRLLEDVRRLDPSHPIANAYWGWINRHEPPPPFVSASTNWAERQLLLLKYFRQTTDWWIDNRQLSSGEMGGGLGDDTDMVQNWPGVALLDGPVEKIKSSIRRVVEACYAQGMIERGMNARRTDALHAYEEGMNAYGPAFLLDYGNPVLFERMMETASHYARLTGINAAGHRHFRSYQYSATDLVEEGYHAREDIYSHLILHPGLYVAWYNGSPALKSLLREFADGLLAHWKKERYPNLAKRIFFADDRVEDRTVPNTETFNLFWGLYDMDRDDKYLWLLREAVRAGDLSRAGAVNGPWLNTYEPSDILGALEEEVRRRNINDHNLQTDQTGLVARTLAWQASGNRRNLEEADQALTAHMAQNLYLYTEAEQFTDRIWIPTLAVQRARMGGVAHYRNHIYPGHAVSWEDTGGEVAALVPAARPDFLSLLAFNTASGPRRTRARVWQLENGLYEVTAREENGAVLSSRSLRLKRYSPVDLDLPSRKSVIVEFRQTGRGVPLARLPDLAMAAEEVRDNGGLEIRVHNIGAVSSGPFTVLVRDEPGKVLAQSKQSPLAAPVDLKPQVVVVHFPGVALRSGIRISVEGNQEEICDENNQIRLP